MSNTDKGPICYKIRSDGTRGVEVEIVGSRSPQKCAEEAADYFLDLSYDLYESDGLELMVEVTNYPGRPEPVRYRVRCVEKVVRQFTSSVVIPPAGITGRRYT